MESPHRPNSWQCKPDTCFFLEEISKLSCQRSMKRHITPWLDHSWNMLQLCGTRTPKSEPLKFNKSSTEVPTGQSIILTKRPVQLGYYKNLDGEHWNKGVRMPAFAWYGLAEVPLPAYIELSGRNSRYPHSMTFRQVYTSCDYYIINTPFSLLL